MAMPGGLPTAGVRLEAQQLEQFKAQMREANEAVRGMGRTATQQISNFQALQAAVKDFARGWAMAAGVVGAGVAITLRAVNAYNEYVQGIGNVARALRTSNEEASRAVNIADDFGIGQAELTAAMRIALQQGVEPTVDGLARLSDEYLSIADTQERARFAQQRLGRGWLAFTRVLEAGGARIREMGASIEDGLIVTQEAYEASEKYRISVDKLGESFAVLRNTAVQGLIGPMTEGNLRISLFIQGMLAGKDVIQAWGNAVVQAHEQYQGMQVDLAEAPPALDKMAAAAKNAVRELGPIPSIFDSIDRSVGNAISGLMDDIEFIQAGGAQIQQGYEAVQEALTAGRITPEQAQQMLGNYFIEYEHLQTELGNQRPWQEAEHLAERFGIRYDQALEQVRTGYRGLRADIPQGLFEEVFGKGAPIDLTKGWVDAISGITDMSKWANAKKGSEDLADPIRDAAASATKILSSLSQLPKEIRINITVTGMPALKLQHGGAGVVPAGYPNDSYPIFLSSGERYVVTPPATTFNSPSYTYDNRQLSIGQIGPFGQGGPDMANPFVRTRVINAFFGV